MSLEKIVVGTDGSPYAMQAVRWAVDEAAVHGGAVEAVLIWSLFNQHYPDHGDRYDHGYSAASAQAALEAWLGEALDDPKAVAQRVVCDIPVRGLLEAGDAADLLVLGARGTGGFKGLLLGSVTDRVTQLATRPVAVVREPAAVTNGRVVVGVDGSTRSRHAVRWAAAEARARDAALEVVHSWPLPVMTGPPELAVLPDFGTLEHNGRLLLETTVADPALQGLTVHSHLSAGSPARALLERAEDATLVVVGSRGLGRVAGALVGSVTRQLLHHSPCPVVVI